MEQREDLTFGNNLVITPVTVGTPLVLQASSSTSDRIRALAIDNGVGDAELVKLAMALMQVYTEAKKQGRHLAVVDGEGNVVEEIAGP
jgi:hypothetical protein